MIEYQVWLTIREAYREPDENNLQLLHIVNELDSKLKKEYCNILGDYIFGEFNGFWKLAIVGARNHPTGDWPKILALLDWIAENAPGSYGMASMIDSDDYRSVNRAFAVYVMKKGVISIRDDVYLSPYYEEVEEL